MKINIFLYLLNRALNLGYCGQDKQMKFEGFFSLNSMKNYIEIEKCLKFNLAPLPFSKISN